MGFAEARQCRTTHVGIQVLARDEPCARCRWRGRRRRRRGRRRRGRGRGKRRRRGRQREWISRCRSTSPKAKPRQAQADAHVHAASRLLPLLPVHRLIGHPPLPRRAARPPSLATCTASTSSSATVSSSTFASSPSLSPSRRAFHTSNPASQGQGRQATVFVVVKIGNGCDSC